MDNTISFDEDNNGWNSFWSYNPEWMLRLGNSIYSFKKGQLFRHNSDVSPKNYFYEDGGQLAIKNSSIRFVFNQDPSDVKHFKTISLESNDNMWDITINTNLDSGFIEDSNLDTREGEHYAYIRRNESDVLNFNHLSIQGIGVPTTISINTYSFSSVPSFISHNDRLYYKNALGNVVYIGTVVSFDSTSITTTTPALGTVIEPSGFYFIAKNTVAESYGVKGYFAEVELKSTGAGTKQELYSVNTEASKSFQ